MCNEPFNYSLVTPNIALSIHVWLMNKLYQFLEGPSFFFFFAYFCAFICYNVIFICFVIYLLLFFIIFFLIDILFVLKLFYINSLSIFISCSFIILLLKFSLCLIIYFLINMLLTALVAMI